MKLDHFKAMYLEDVQMLAALVCPACKCKSLGYNHVTHAEIACKQTDCGFAIIISRNYSNDNEVTWFVFGFEWQGTYTYYNGQEEWTVLLPSYVRVLMHEPEDQEIETLLAKIEKLLLLD